MVGLERRLGAASRLAGDRLRAVRRNRLLVGEELQLGPPDVEMLAFTLAVASDQTSQ